MKKISKHIYEAVRNYKENQGEKCSITKIAQQNNIDRHTFSKYLNKDLSIYNIEYKDYYYYFEERDNLAIQMYLNGNSLSDIYKKTKLKSELVKARLQILNISYERKFLVNFDRNIFHNIDTEEKAY